MTTKKFTLLKKWMNSLEHEDPERVRLPDLMDTFIRLVGHVVCWVNALLLVTIITQVLLRYLFSISFVALEELQWHFYAIGVMMGLSYAQTNDNHVRVDIFHSRFSDQTKRLVEIFAILVFVFPMVFVVFYHSLDFVYDSWRTDEASFSDGGLQYRFLIKTVIPISFGLLGLASLSRLSRDVYLLVKAA